MSGQRDLRLVALAAILCAALALLIPLKFLSLLFLTPLAFFLPGYAITAATLVRNQTQWPQTLVISAGLSLAVLAIGGLPLNYLGGLTPATWALLLVLVTLLACRLAAWRRPSDWTSPRPQPMLQRPSALNATLACLALLAVVAAVVLAFVPLSAKHAIGYTELWLRTYSTAAGAGVRVGVGNEEKQATAYVVRVRFAGGRSVSASRVSLDPGNSAVVRMPATPPPTTEPVFALVQPFLAGEPGRPYRQVYDWVPPPGGESP